jgi:DNA-binding NtrC family response regulator
MDNSSVLSKSLKHQETILIVDDEDALIQITQTMLHSTSYNTIAAYSGESALEIYKKKRDEIDLILLDLGMPGMGGKHCMKKLLHIDPDVKIIVTSGYSDESIINKMINDGAKHFVIKPYTFNELSKAIRSVLDTKEI